MKSFSKKLCFGLITIMVAAIVVMSPIERVDACGSSPFLGEICAFGFNFCPVGFAATNGQLLSIAQNTALFALLGTTYGGDGITTFALPDLRGRSVVGSGQGAGLSAIVIGQTGGAEQVTLSVNQIPSHAHSATTSVDVQATLRGTSNTAILPGPQGKVLARANPSTPIYSTSPANVDMAGSSIATSANATTTVGSTGGGQAVDTRSPFLGLTYCIALQGVFPSHP